MQECETWAEYGYCQNGEYLALMENNCRLACSFCSDHCEAGFYRVGGECVACPEDTYSAYQVLSSFKVLCRKFTSENRWIMIIVEYGSCVHFVHTPSKHQLSSPSLPVSRAGSARRVRRAPRPRQEALTCRPALLRLEIAGTRPGTPGVTCTCRTGTARPNPPSWPGSAVGVVGFARTIWVRTVR